MSKWSDAKLVAKYDQMSAKHPNGVYAAALKAEMARRGIA